jgi:hypothetical protein
MSTDPGASTLRDRVNISADRPFFGPPGFTAWLRSILTKRWQVVDSWTVVVILLQIVVVILQHTIPCCV